MLVKFLRREDRNLACLAIRTVELKLQWWDFGGKERLTTSVWASIDDILNF